jgi:hypothetical protein
MIKTHFVNVAARHVVHLLRAVEDVDHHAERTPEIFRSFGLPGSGRTGRRASHDKMKRLSQRYVTTIGQRCDHQSGKRQSTLSSRFLIAYYIFDGSLSVFDFLFLSVTYFVSISVSVSVSLSLMAFAQIFVLVSA